MAARSLPSARLSAAERMERDAIVAAARTTNDELELQAMLAKVRGLLVHTGEEPVRVPRTVKEGIVSLLEKMQMASRDSDFSSVIAKANAMGDWDLEGLQTVLAEAKTIRQAKK